MSPTPQTPPTDRPLTACDVPLLRYGDFVRCSFPVFGALIQDRDYIFDRPHENDSSDIHLIDVEASWRVERFTFVSRPATSAASEVVEGWLSDAMDAALHKRDFNLTEASDAILAALASPPVSERERELEGALDLCSAALQRLHTDIEALMADSEGVSGLHHNGDVATWGDLGQGGQFSDWLGDPLWAARNAWHDARRVLTAQPAGEPTHG